MKAVPTLQVSLIFDLPTVNKVLEFFGEILCREGWWWLKVNVTVEAPQNLLKPWLERLLVNRNRTSHQPMSSTID